MEVGTADLKGMDMSMRNLVTASLKQRFDIFLYSRWYLIAVVLVAAAGNLLSLELFAYSVFALIFMYTCFCGRDLLPLMPLFILAYVTPSSRNNPGCKEDTIFTMAGGGAVIICIAVLIVVSILYRVIRDRKRFFGRKYKLLPGILLLTLAYMVGGIGSGTDWVIQGKSAFFGLMQGCAILIPYFLFCGGVDWEEVDKEYFAWIGVGTGCLLLAEVLWLYLTADVIIDGSIERDNIYTGWGICNNIGGMLIMMIPFAFHLSLKKYYRNWFGVLVASAFLLGAYFTCSRAAMIIGTGIYLLCFFLMLRYAEDRKYPALMFLLFVVCLVLVLVIRWDRVKVLFEFILRRGLKLSKRDIVYPNGFKLFLQNPLLGTTFYPPAEVAPYDFSSSEAFSSFFPARWHNTIIQLLACCGLFGLVSYGLHRWQTVKLFFWHPTVENLFVAASILTLLLASLVDCHFFNIGPVLFYAMALAFVENSHLCQIYQP